MKAKLMHSRVLFLAFALLCQAGSAFAQYVWLDERGLKQFSDQPPPASVPASRILKQPRGGSTAAPAQAPAEPKAAAAVPAAPSVAERNAEFRKRQAERAEKEKKAAEESRMAAEKAEMCERASANRRALESGVRLASVDKDGERNFLSDEQRAKELRDTDRVLAGCR